MHECQRELIEVNCWRKTDAELALSIKSLSKQFELVHSVISVSTSNLNGCLPCIENLGRIRNVLLRLWAVPIIAGGAQI
jgi:hypothetical protein